MDIHRYSGYWMQDKSRQTDYAKASSVKLTVGNWQSAVGTTMTNDYDNN